MVNTCKTQSGLKDNQELQKKIIEINKRIPALELLPKKPFNYRLLFGSIGIMALITIFIHKKYGLSSIPSHIKSFFKK